jgi:hypothetical protein
LIIVRPLPSRTTNWTPDYLRTQKASVGCRSRRQPLEGTIAGQDGNPGSYAGVHTQTEAEVRVDNAIQQQPIRVVEMARITVRGSEQTPKPPKDRPFGGFRACSARS